MQATSPPVWISICVLSPKPVKYVMMISNLGTDETSLRIAQPYNDRVLTGRPIPLMVFIVQHFHTLIKPVRMAP